jgi:hypothetical protein
MSTGEVYKLSLGFCTVLLIPPEVLIEKEK